MTRGRWDVNPSVIVYTDVHVVGPDNPMAIDVTEFVNPITLTVVTLVRPMPYAAFAEAWPAIVRWLRDGWDLFYADPREL
jgi:hypothetical protein